MDESDSAGAFARCNQFVVAGALSIQAYPALSVGLVELDSRGHVERGAHFPLCLLKY
jgi:hypothetical protein